MLTKEDIHKILQENKEFVADKIRSGEPFFEIRIPGDDYNDDTEPVEPDPQ